MTCVVPETFEDIDGVIDEQSPSGGHEGEVSAKRSRTPKLRLDALKGLSLGVPQRIHAILAAEDACLTPGPCQSEHTLAAALGLEGADGAARPAQNDPTFGELPD